MSMTHLPDLERELFNAAARRATPATAAAKRRVWFRRPLVLGVATAALTASVAGAVVAGHRDVKPEIVAQLGVLRQPTGPQDALGPAGNRLAQLQELKQRTQAQSAHPEAIRVLNFAASRRVGATVPGLSLWIAPSDNDGAACLIAVRDDAAIGQIGACLDTPDAATGSSPQTSSFAGQTDVYGIVPDGVTTVTLRFRDGATEKISVQDNVYAATTTRPTQSVSYEANGKRITRPAPSG